MKINWNKAEVQNPKSRQSKVHEKATEKYKTEGKPEATENKAGHELNRHTDGVKGKHKLKYTKLQKIPKMLTNETQERGRKETKTGSGKSQQATLGYDCKIKQEIIKPKTKPITLNC